ncbi:MAG: hypothetical protein N2440_02120 [Actinobacteria bacterium]|nr:hypothetical protein [Actinomycetota bacterium]
MDRRTVSEVSSARKPNRKQPIQFTAAVPTGKVVFSQSWNHPEVRYLKIEPIAPPTKINSKRIR